MILVAIKESIKEDKFLNEIVSAYFEVVGEYSEEKLLELYNVGAKMGGSSIEDSLIMGIKCDKNNFEKTKEILEKRKLNQTRK